MPNEVDELLSFPNLRQIFIGLNCKEKSVDDKQSSNTHINMVVSSLGDANQ